MKRNIELRLLLVVLLIINIGFLILSSSYVDRGVSYLLKTKDGILNIAPYFLDFFPNGLYATFFVAVFLLAHIFLRWRLPEADPLLLPLTALLSGIGLLLILRLSPDLAFVRNEAIRDVLARNPEAQITDNVLSLAQLGMKYFTFLVIGILVLLASSCISNQVFSRLSSKKYIWVFLSAILILCTLFFGVKINGRRLWLFGFQTVEVVKFLMILFMAGYIYERGKGILVYGKGDFGAWAKYAAPFAVMCFFGLVPIVLQRDFGPTVLLFAVFLLIFHYAGNRWTVTLIFIMLLCIAGYASYKTGLPSVVRERFDMMADPFTRSESMSRVLWAISSGGLSGAGIGYGQAHRIPEVQSDFSFTAVCEEMGFVGGLALILAYAALIVRCLKIASATSNVYRKTLVTGIAALIGVQSFLIICGNLGGIPLTGITLPLVSYGGSALLVNFLMIGIVLRISGEEKK